MHPNTKNNLLEEKLKRIIEMTNSNSSEIDHMHVGGKMLFHYSFAVYIIIISQIQADLHLSSIQ